ncbi:PAPA-1-like conserved region-domain-containing protein [Sparassis latifolia]
MSLVETTKGWTTKTWKQRRKMKRSRRILTSTHSHRRRPRCNALIPLCNLGSRSNSNSRDSTALCLLQPPRQTSLSYPLAVEHLGIDIESEDTDEDELGSTRSASVATTGTAGRPLTARQAVLANVVDPSHVSLVEPPNPRKKKPLTEGEIALKREETARKRKNLTEKKLADEKAETINRLLKKQTRKGKRNALSTADDRPTPGSAPHDDKAQAPVPTMYRWISSSRPQPQPGEEVKVKKVGMDVEGEGEGEEPKERENDKEREGEGQAEKAEPTMYLSFSVPIAALPPAAAQPAGTTDVDVAAARTPPRCDVRGCTQRRKYRLVKDWQRGACGLGHLKLLEAQLA